MTKSELIENLVRSNPSLPVKTVESAVKDLLDHLSLSLS